MINKEQLYQKFSTAVLWNSVLFFINKISKTAISFLLFSKLVSHDFSVWANVYSFVFIFELWTDFGFRRALPQYCLIFTKNNKDKKSFIFKVIIFKILVSLIVNLFFLIFTPQIASFLKLQNYVAYFYLGCLLFFVSGIKSVLQLIFYSYFWQRAFNLTESFIITLHIISIFIAISIYHSSASILYFTFISQIIATCVMIAVASFMLRFLLKDQDYQGKQRLNTKRIMKDFIRHSSAMWGVISINSLTERNFLLPFLTYTLGHNFANIFKVANDAALLFQRFVIKSIGTTGTSLFSHVETRQLKKSNLSPSDLVAKEENRGHLQQSNNDRSEVKSNLLLLDIFQKLMKRTISLVFPLFGILLFIFLKSRQGNIKLLYFSSANQYIFKIFLLLATLYLTQIIFMAYERILEVKRLYKKLFISFTPYVGIILFFVYCLYVTTPLTLPFILLFIHSLRILSLSIRIGYSKLLFHFKFPIKYSLIFATSTLLATLSLYFVFFIFS